MCDKLGNHTHCCQRKIGCEQTLDEMDFERGIWGAVQARDIDRVRKLLASGTFVDQIDAGGYTALHYAVRIGDEDIVSELIRAGADINARTRAGQATPLHRAVSAGKYGVVNLLLEKKADINAVDSDGKTILHRAAETQIPELCKKLIALNVNLLKIPDCRDRIPIDYVDTNNFELRSVFLK